MFQNFAKSIRCLEQQLGMLMTSVQYLFAKLGDTPTSLLHLAQVWMLQIRLATSLRIISVIVLLLLSGLVCRRRLIMPFRN